MWNTNMIIVLTFYLIVALNSLNSQMLVYGQLDEVNDTANNNSELELMANNTMSAGTVHNDTRIMENTSGMIDEAFGALKDSFKTLFGK